MAAAYFGYPPDPAHGAPPQHSYYQQAPPPPPPQQYSQYQTAPVGYPAPPAQNGYTHPSSPQQSQSQPVMRPHTAAPYATAAHPPPPMYYSGPPTNGQTPGSPQAPAPPQPNGAQPPPSAGGNKGDLFGSLERDPLMQEALAKYLADLKLNKDGAAADKGPPAPAPPRPRSASSAPAPPPSEAPPQQSRNPLQQFYEQYLRAAAPAPPPAPLGPNGTQTPAGYGGAPMPGGFYDDLGPSSKTPTGRPENYRQISEFSERSFASGSTTTRKQKEDDKTMFYNLWGGELVGREQGKPGPRPKEKLMDLLTSIAHYLIQEIEPKNSLVVTEEKLRNFYTIFSIADEPQDWKAFFQTRQYDTVSRLFANLRCEHHLVPIVPHEVPTQPGLTPKGFETWMFTQLMVSPHVETQRLQKILDKWPIYDFKTDQRFPKYLPRECLPPRRDDIMYRAWCELKNAFPPDQPTDPDSDDDAHSPTYNPSYLRGGHISPAASAPEDEDDELILPHRKRISQTAQSLVPKPTDFLTKQELGSDNEVTSPPIEERSRHPYNSSASATSNWREDLNPRPTLGEEPTRRQSAHHHGPRDARVPKSHHTQPDAAAPAPPVPPPSTGNRHRRHKSRVRREPSPPPSWEEGSDEEDERTMRKIEPRAPSRGPGSSRKEWEGIPMGIDTGYNPYPEEPPFHMTSPHSYGSAEHERHGRSEESSRHSAPRAKSRGPPPAHRRERASTGDEDAVPIEQFRYQTDYMRAAAPAPPVSGGAGSGRPRTNTSGSRRSIGGIGGAVVGSGAIVHEPHYRRAGY